MEPQQPNMQKNSVPQEPYRGPQEPSPEQQAAASASIKPKKNIVKILLTLFLLALIIGGGLYFYFSIYASGSFMPSNEEQKEEVVEENPVIVEEEKVDDGLETFVNKEYEYLFRYPEDLRLEEINPFSEDPTTVLVFFEGERQVEPLVDETNLEDGYVFKVLSNENTFNATARSLVEEKRKRYAVNCFTNTKISQPKEVNVGGFIGIQFDVENCTRDFRETYIVNNGNVYEIVEITRGDIGYRQAYKSSTNELFRSFRFTNVIEPTPVETWVTEDNQRDGFIFLHPSLDSTCCNVSGPKSREFRKVGVYADTATLLGQTENAFNGFGIYVFENPDKVSFEEFLTQEKQALVDNYKVIVGRAPDESESKVEVGGYEAIRLRGHAWWGDMIFMQIPGSSKFLNISTTEIATGQFEDVLTQVFRGFEFTLESDGTSFTRDEAEINVSEGSEPADLEIT